MTALRHAFPPPPPPACDKELIVLIPAKNEEASVGEVIRKAGQWFPGKVLLVDDHSSDRTVEVAMEAGATVLKLPLSLGAWGAIQTGLRYALRHGFQAAITMDADGQHEAESVSALHQALRSSGADVVIGAYPQRGSSARRLAWSVFRRVSGLTLEDLTSGLRAYNRHAIRLLASRRASLLDYQDMGVLLLLRSEGLEIVEIPITMKPRNNGHSRIFSSWWAVSCYMLHTLTLCLARAPRPSFGFHKSKSRVISRS